MIRLEFNNIKTKEVSLDKKILNTKHILTDSFKMVYQAGIHLLLFEIIYKGLIMILFKPILNLTVSLFIRAGGYEILINGDISRFLLSFTGVLMVVIVMSMSVFLVYYEFSVILLILDSSKRKEEMKLLDITETALLKLRKVITSRQIGLALYILVLIPIVNIGIQSSLVPTLSIPDFITGEVAKYPGSEILFLIMGLALVTLFAKLFISLPIMIFSDQSFKQASTISFKTIKGEGFQIAFVITAGMLVWVILTYLPFMIVENAQFILFRVLRGFFNISMTLFTLLISPFVLSLSLESYNAYVKSGELRREDGNEKIELGFLGQKVWRLLEAALAFVQASLFKIRKHLKAVLLIGLALVIVINIYVEESGGPICDKQLLIGHRGGEYGVENAIDTLMFAGLNGADYIEMDVLLTSDHVPVVIHDNNLKRLANISANISDLTLEEVKQITIRGGGKEANIPALEELVKEVKGKTKLLLEFQTHGQEKVSVIDQTITVLAQAGILEETIFQTSDYQMIEEFNEKYHDLPIGYVFIGKIGTFSAKKMAKMPIDFVSAEESLINKNMIQEIHKSGKAIFAWTINDDYKAERLLELGVDGLITDYPVEMIELRDQYKDYHDIKKEWGQI